MKKILSRIFSVALIAATAISPAYAQTLKKAKSSSASPGKATVTMKAQSETRQSASRGDKGLNVLPKRTVESAIRSAKPARLAGRHSVIAREGANVPTLYGGVIYQNGWSQDSAPAGIYDVTQAQTESVCQGPNVSYGGVLVDDVYYSVDGVVFWGMAFVTISGYDIESEELLFSYDGVLENMCPGGLVYDATTGKVYGISYNADGSALQLASFTFTETEATVTPIATLDGNWNTIAVTPEGQLYGISYVGHTEGDSFVVDESTLNKIDKTTGAVTAVGQTGKIPTYMSSGAIDPKSGRMFWNVCSEDGTSVLCEVNLTTGVATELFEYVNGDEIMGMYVPAPAAAENAPAECENVSVNFANGSLSGNVSLTTPATLYDGTTAGSGELIVIVMANGEQVGYAEAGWNSPVTIDVDLSLMGAGKYNFTVFASNDNGEGPRTNVKNVWIGPDTPEATKATLVYANGNMELSWTAVEGSINGGYIDLANLTYKVVRDNGTVAAEGLTTTSFTEAVAAPEAITTYYYTVYAVCGGLTSAPAQSNSVVLGSIIPPYTPDFAADGLAGYTQIDGDEDGKLWTVNSDGNLEHSFNSKAAIDDWLITPPVKLEAGKAYLVSFDYWNNSHSYVETLEVKWGADNTVAGMTNTLLAATEVSGNVDSKKSFSQYMVPEQSGTYYIGFHSLSAADQYKLIVGNFSIAGGVSSAAPGAVTNLKAVPAQGGALSAEISFNAPDKTMAGDALTSLDKVELLRGTEVIETFSAPAVGSPLSYTDNVDADGDYEYTVVGYNANGAGVTATTSVYIGVNFPAAVSNATIVRTAVDGEVTVSWDAVTTDIAGMQLSGDQVKYDVYAFEGSSRVLLASDLTATTYSYQAVEAGEQDFVQCAVFAKTKAGEGDGTVTGMIPAGTPYNGLAESFANGELHYIWGLRAIGGGTVGIYDDETFEEIVSQDGDSGFIGIEGSSLDSGADFFSGLVSLNQVENPGLTFYLYNILGDDPDEITVSVCTSDAAEFTPVLTGTVNDLCNGIEGWNKITVNLTSYANKVIQFQITGITKNYVYKLIDNIKVGSILANDVAAMGITAPGRVKTGENFSVDVKVSNDGTQTASAFSVELYADNEVVATQNVETLESGAVETVKFDCAMSALATEPISYYAKVVYAADENEANNQTASIEVAPVVSNLPKATDLAGQSVETGIKLEWNEPNLDGGVPQEITDDFEDGDAFAAEYGNWTFVDGDASPVGGFQGMEIPNITAGETAGSFWIWDQTDGIGNFTFKAHSGMKYLFALFRYDDGTTDDWAISPELPGIAQTISFYAKSYSAQYPEKIEVYYSTGSKEPSDFIKIDGVGGVVPGPQGNNEADYDAAWTEYTASLPAGAKYFAIRSCATGSFMLMVDDVTYTPAGLTANLEIAGYNIYRDGVKINDAPVADCSYIDTNVKKDSQYTYVVTVVYTEKGESAGSNEVVVKATGVDGIYDGSVSIMAETGKIVVLNAEGLKVTVAAANGAVVYNGKGELRTEVAVGNGVYVVSAGKTVKKVIVK